MNKKLIFVGLMMLTLATGVVSVACGVAHRVAEKRERAYLLDFIHYCQGNRGLRQIDPNKDYTKSTTHDLKNLATFYLDQYNFDDVSDYWDVSVMIASLIITRTHVRIIT